MWTSQYEANVTVHSETRYRVALTLKHITSTIYCSFVLGCFQCVLSFTKSWISLNSQAKTSVLPTVPLTFDYFVNAWLITQPCRCRIELILASVLLGNVLKC